MAMTLNDAVGIVNESLISLGYEFQISTESDETIEAGLKAIGAYAPTQRNAIMEQMNLILQQRNYGVMFNAEKNKFRSFLVDMTDEGFGIEDVFHELIEGTDPLWDDKSDEANTAIVKDLVSYDSNKIHKFFHTKPFERIFKSTIDRRNYDKVFTKRGVTRYIDTKLANMQWSAEVYLMNVAVNLAKDMISNNHILFHTGHNVNNKQGLVNLVEDVKTCSAGFLTPSAEYNIGYPEYDESTGTVTFKPVVNMTNSEDDIFVITTPEIMQRIRVQDLANTFNMSEREFEGRIIYAPAGTQLGTISDEQVYMIVIDRRTLLLGLRMWSATSKFIENVHRFNNWLAVEGVQGYNTVFNAVAFTGEEYGNFTDGSGDTPVTVENKPSYIYLGGDYGDTAPTFYSDGTELVMSTDTVPLEDGSNGNLVKADKLPVNTFRIVSTTSNSTVTVLVNGRSFAIGEGGTGADADITLPIFGGENIKITY